MVLLVVHASHTRRQRERTTAFQQLEESVVEWHWPCPGDTPVTWGKMVVETEEADQAETIPAYRPVHRLRSLLPAENILIFDLDLLLPHAMEKPWNALNYCSLMC